MFPPVHVGADSAMTYIHPNKSVAALIDNQAVGNG